MGRPVVFFDIGCEDKEKTVKFYRDLFGWTSASSNPYSDTIETESEVGQGGSAGVHWGPVVSASFENATDNINLPGPNNSFPQSGVPRSTPARWGFHHTINPASGWVQNTNNWPFSAGGDDSPRIENYPSYMDTRGENPRGLHAVRVLEREDDFTLETLIDAAFDSDLTAFERRDRATQSHADPRGRDARHGDRRFDGHAGVHGTRTASRARHRRPLGSVRVLRELVGNAPRDAPLRRPHHRRPRPRYHERERHRAAARSASPRLGS